MNRGLRVRHRQWAVFLLVGGLAALALVWAGRS